ncbi:MAG: nitroreductase family protein, partial [Candidatus Bilamarchaeaceae archaeon]
KVKQKLVAEGMGKKLAERAKMNADAIFYGAPLLILIVAEKSAWSEADCNLAAQNMMLRAYDLGLGSCYIGYMNRLREDRETLRELGIKDNQELYCPLIFGYPKRWPEPKEREPEIQKRIK